MDGRDEGKTRTVRKFLWLPRCFDVETRWLKYTEILEKNINVTTQYLEGDDYEWRWVEIGFATPKTFDELYGQE